MQNLLFFLWMILYPIADALSSRIVKYKYSTKQDSVDVLVSVLLFLIEAGTYFGVGYLLYNK